MLSKYYPKVMRMCLLVLLKVNIYMSKILHLHQVIENLRNYEFAKECNSKNLGIFFRVI